MRDERELMEERIEKDLVAFGEFTAGDLMQNSVCPEDFLSLDNPVEGEDKRKKSGKTSVDLDDDESSSGYKLSLFSPDKT